MATLTNALFNANRYASTQTNLDGDDFIYTDAVDSGWIGGADVNYALVTGDTAIALANAIVQSDKTFNFKLFEGATITEGSGTQIVPFRTNRLKTGRPLSLRDAEREPTITDPGTQVWEKNFLIGTDLLASTVAAENLSLGIILKPETTYILNVNNTGDAQAGTLEFDLRFTALASPSVPTTTVSLLPASI